MAEAESTNRDGSAAVCRYGNAAILGLAAVYFFLIPGVIVIHDLCDPKLREPGVPRCAVRWHRSLTPKYERWARTRIVAAVATGLDTSNISGT